MSPRRDIEELLPACVNGTASAEQRAAVERSRCEDPAIDLELRFLDRLGEQLRSSAGPSPGELGWQRLRRSIEQGERKHGNPWWPPLAAAAAALVILVQGGMLWQLRDDAADGYAPLGVDSAADVQIRFAPAAAAADIATLLRAENLAIVSGPSAAGLYRIDAIDEGADLDALVGRLSGRNDIVAFAARE